MVEVEDLFAEVEVFERRRPACAHPQRVLIVGDGRARLVVAGHASCHDEGLRLRARFGETALDECDVKAFLHARVQT